MKKIVAMSGIVAFLAIVLVFSACATLSAWWSGQWVWGAAMLLSEGQVENAELPTIVLSGSNQNPAGVFVDQNGTELAMTDIDLTQKGFITFVVNGEEKTGTFDFENGMIIEK